MPETQSEPQTSIYTDILYEVDDSIAWIAINRPDKLNAYRTRTLLEIIHAVQTAGEDREVGVIVISGVGDRAFSAGGDVETEDTEAFNSGADSLDEVNKRLYEVFRGTPKPIIAMVHGYAIGGGNHLAYFCDLTIASSTSIFGQNGPRVASPAEGIPVAMAVAVLGVKRAKELWMVLKKYSAEEALSWGLVNAVVEPDELENEVRKWAGEMLVLSPSVLGIVKRTFDEAVLPTIDVLRERKLIHEMYPDFFESGEQEEGASAFMEKRKPDFSKFR